MAYYSRHSIFLYDNDKQKLLYLQSLIEEEKLSFELREETVYQYDGEPLNILCISDANYDPEIKTEDGFENLYEFQDGCLSSDEDIIHYQTELQKVCEELNLMASETPLQLYEVMDIAHHPTIIFHYGAYTFIGYNIYEIYSYNNFSFDTTAAIASSSRNYDSLPNRIKAQQILYDNLLERRKKGTLR